MVAQAPESFDESSDRKVFHRVEVDRAQAWDGVHSGLEHDLA